MLFSQNLFFSLLFVNCSFFSLFLSSCRLSKTSYSIVKQSLSHNYCSFLKKQTAHTLQHFYLNSLPQVIYPHIFSSLNRALYLSYIFRALYDSNTQSGRVCVSNHSGKPCTLQGKTASSQGNLDKSKLAQYPIVTGG